MKKEKGKWQRGKGQRPAMTQVGLCFPWWCAPFQAERDGVHVLPGAPGRGAGPAGVPAGRGVAVPARGDILCRGRVQRRHGLPAPRDAQCAPSRGHRGRGEATVSHPRPALHLESDEEWGHPSLLPAIPRLWAAGEEGTAQLGCWPVGLLVFSLFCPSAQT